MKTNPHIVSTRILNKGLIESLESAGSKVIQYDFIEKTIRIDHVDAYSINNTIVLTSKTGVQAWVRILEKFKLNKEYYKVYCLAAATQTICVENGLPIAGVAADASSLSDIILKNNSIRSVTFVCGNLRRDELPERLRENGIKVHETEVYRTEFSSVKIELPYHGVLFFSPSGVDSFLSLNQLNSSAAFCLGKTTASHAREAGYQEIYVSETHTPASLVEMVINHYKNKPIHA